MNDSSLEPGILAIDAGGSSIKLGVFRAKDVSAGPLCRSNVPVPDEGSVEALSAAFAEAGSLGAGLAIDRGLRLFGVGVCTPGPFDYPRGASLMTHKYRSIRGMSIRSFIERGSGPIPIRFFHDSFAFLVGELSVHTPIDYRSPCAAIVGTGLGFAAMQGGRLMANETRGPGISIFKVPFRAGIAEDYVSKRGLMNLYRALGGRRWETVRDLDLAARDGEALCVRVFAESGEALAEILAPILKENGFDLLILGGQIAKAGALMAGPCAHRLRVLGVECRVDTAGSIDEAPLIGAARLFQDEEAFI